MLSLTPTSSIFLLADSTALLETHDNFICYTHQERNASCFMQPVVVDCFNTLCQAKKTISKEDMQPTQYHTCLLSGLLWHTV